MRTRKTALIAILPFLFVGAALSASQSGAHLCQSSDGPGRTIACSHASKIDVDTYLKRAAAYLAKGNFELAITELDEATRLNPDAALAYRMRGKAYKATGNNDQAVADFSRAIQLNPYEAVDYKNRGTAYQGKQDLDHALVDYDKAVELSPNDPVAYFLRSAVYEAKGDLDRAIADYDAVIHLEPKDPLAVVALTQRAEDYEVKGDFDRAIADYSDAMRLNPRDPTMEDNRGNAYQAKGDFHHAIIDYDSAIQINSKDSFAYRGRGLAYFLRGFSHQAYNDFRIANKLDPSDAYAALWLDVASYRIGRLSSLSNAVVHIDMSRWPAPAIRRFLGEITAEDLRLAAEDIDPSTRRDRICEADFYNGELELRKGSMQAATSFLRAAASECPKNLIEWVAANAEVTTIEYSSR
jgi:tetratricopeptide (TPR) repeat protein